MPEKSIIQNEYLHHYLKRQNKIPISEKYWTPPSLIQPLKLVEYGKEGIVDIKKGDLKISFSYKPIPKHILALREETVWYGYNKEQCKILDGFKIINKAKGAEIDLQDILPKNHKVIFIPDKRIYTCYAAFNFNKRICTIIGDLSKLLSTIALLHEIGHTWNKVHIQLKKNSSDIELARFLKSERNAWAFALKQIKPLLDKNNFPKRYYGLRSYIKFSWI